MMVEVAIISQDTIKPSSSTPPHLQHYKLSFLDQMTIPVFMPMIFFYVADKNLTYSDRPKQLKKSLSEALTIFYPLAGRYLVENAYIDCNDEGVPYFEAHVNCNLSDVIIDPIPEEMNKFIPCDPDNAKDLCLVIQVNFFNCGGMAIGVCMSHKIADGLSLFMFFRSWAAISRGDIINIQYPNFGASTLFPPIDLGGFKLSPVIVKDCKTVTKRFVFSAAKIAELREKYTDNTNVDYPKRFPSRIEALTAFIGTRFMAAIHSKEKRETRRRYALHEAVNLRRRFDPPLPDCYFGNISRMATAILSLSKLDDEICFSHDVIKEVRDAVNRVGVDYVNHLRKTEEHFNFIKHQVAKISSEGEVVSCRFSSLCRFPLHEADFGWGRPVWVVKACSKYKNVIVFMDTASGDGIEAWVHMEEEVMTKFEADKILTAFLSTKKEKTLLCQPNYAKHPNSTSKL